MLALAFTVFSNFTVSGQQPAQIDVKSIKLYKQAF
jgi:hypothetical protein